MLDKLRAIRNRTKSGTLLVGSPLLTVYDSIIHGGNHAPNEAI